MTNPLPAVIALLALHSLPLAAQPACTDADAAQPVALFERFTSADCASCWQDSTTPAPGPEALVLDWIVPGQQGDDAPLAPAATRDALLRLQALGRAIPAATDVYTAPVEPWTGLRLRVGQGPAVNDYMGATAEFSARPPGAAWTFHLLLVERLPAGAEGSPVARNIVRNMLQGTWDQRNALSKLHSNKWSELRPMFFPEGAQPERLHTVGWVEGAQGRVVAAARSVCGG
ncbi:MAG: hypothetical protein R3E55_16250 [Burkholderiaceae bacterium]|nr:hypothetical protein [Burkholderiaceae bacterium]